MSAHEESNHNRVLLATGSSGGTIAAVRELSRRGLEVSVISDKFFSTSSWSRFTSASFEGPPERDSRPFLDLLLQIGASSPGQVLLPTSDETAWLYTRNASLLGKHFRLLQPPTEVLQRILDKKLLADAAIDVGISVLPTWEPKSLSDVLASASTFTYPLLIKPRTQVRRTRNGKGEVAHSAEELVENFEEYLSQEHAEKDGHFLTNASLPLLQQFVEIGPEGVCSVSGFIDETGELFVTRLAKKILQRSQPAGVGVCFESLPANPDLSEAVHRLCRKLNYFGIFEVEFIRFQGSWAVIDFNPRLFNQTALDCYRGMPLPFFAYLHAAGKLSELREAVALSQKEDQNRPAVFYDRFTLRAILTAKTLARRGSREDMRYWYAWMKRNAAHSVDFASDKTDRVPGYIHICSETILGTKAIGRFFRSASRVSAPQESNALEVHS